MGGVGSRHRRGEVCRSTGLRIERLDKSSRIVVVEVAVEGHDEGITGLQEGGR